MDDVPKLPEQYVPKAKEMALKHRTKEKCKACYDRGYHGINQLNLLITCHKCVDTDAVVEEWRAFVKDTPELADLSNRLNRLQPFLGRLTTDPTLVTFFDLLDQAMAPDAPVDLDLSPARRLTLMASYYPTARALKNVF